jgi:hypothetical protein
MIRRKAKPENSQCYSGPISILPKRLLAGSAESYSGQVFELRPVPDHAGVRNR